MIAVPWYMSMFYRDDKLSKAYGNYWVRVNLESEHVGYHMIALTGIDMAPDNGAPQFVRVQNSWGSDWGFNGTARLTIESFRRLNIWDNWTFAEKAF
jgi:aminopeptidase C